MRGTIRIERLNKSSFCRYLKSKIRTNLDFFDFLSRLEREFIIPTVIKVNERLVESRRETRALEERDRRRR